MLGVPAYTPFLWQLAQVTPWCWPVRANLAWLKLAGFQPLGVWHWLQAVDPVGMCAAGWL